MESQELVKNRSYWKAIKVREKKEIDQITFKKLFTKGGEKKEIDQIRIKK